MSTRVLVVDDNRDSTELLAFALRLRGYVTSSAHDGPEALRVASTFNPHFAILDVGLPGMNGYQLAAGLRKIDGLGGLKLIALTGYGHDSDRELAFAAGFTSHFVKPVDFDSLDSALKA